MYKARFVDSKYIDLNATYGSDIKSELDSDSFMAIEDYDLCVADINDWSL